MTLEAAKAFEQLKSDESDNFKFVYVSGEGATSEPGRFTALFGRVKGETETALMEMEAKNPHFRAMIVRPALVDPQDHQAILPWIPPVPLWKRLEGAALAPLFEPVSRACIARPSLWENSWLGCRWGLGMGS